MGKNSGWKQAMEKVFDIIGEILAVILVLVFAILLLDAKLDFLANAETFKYVLEGIRGYGTLLLVAVVGLEAMVKRNIIFFLLFLVVIAVCVIMMFFPEVSDYLIGLIPS